MVASHYLKPLSRKPQKLGFESGKAPGPNGHIPASQHEKVGHAAPQSQSKLPPYCPDGIRQPMGHTKKVSINSMENPTFTYPQLNSPAQTKNGHPVPPNDILISENYIKRTGTSKSSARAEHGSKPLSSGAEHGSKPLSSGTEHGSKPLSQTTLVKTSIKLDFEYAPGFKWTHLSF